MLSALCEEGRVADRYRFGGLEFDAASGELRPVDPARGEVRPRLPRQPARLLALLAERAGEVVTREEIREHIWTDTAVEFDASLHFCIRQIRAALGDQASAPQFVETIPRQGYRLIPQVERVSNDGTGAIPERSRAKLTRRVVLGSLLVVACTVASYFSLRDPASPVPPPVRIGIMPFRPPADSRFGEVPPIAEWILEEMTSLAAERVEIVGPTTTVSFEESGIGLLAERYGLGYVVNGRFLSDEEAPAMLAELIRSADGAHVWVRRFDDLADGKGIGIEIGRGVVEELGLRDGE